MLASEWPERTFLLIPAYKSAGLLRSFLPRLLSCVPQDRICVVDDASLDGTEEICKQLGISYISHTENRGKGAALSTGFSHLIEQNARWIITMDADGQHQPEDLHKFLRAVRNNPAMGICIGSRCMKAGVMPVARIFSNVITSGILSLLTGIRVEDSQCGYRVYSSELLQRITIQYNRFEMESEVILKAARLGFQIIFTEVQTVYCNGKSHISHLRDTFRWVRAVIRVYFNLGLER